MENSHRVLRSIEETHRVLRSITTEPYLITTERLEPLHKLQGWNFIDAWFQCAEAHYLAWTHGIHHQDPSLDNLMYRDRRGGQSKACPLLDTCAVLDDWDLAIDASAPQTHTGLEMTGTMQFMAFARLDSGAWDGHLPHIYRHDLEAFFYILAWVLCCYKDGQRLNPLPPLFETWTKGNSSACTKGNARECYDSKYRFIHEQRWPQDSLPTDSWSSAMKVFANIIRLFFTVMLRKLAGSPESWMQSRLDNIMARAGGRALPPPKEDDKPTEIWEDFCGAVKEGLLILSDRMNLKKEDLPPRLASFLPDSQMNTPS